MLKCKNWNREQQRGGIFLGYVQQCYYEGSIYPSAHVTHLSNAEQLLN